jgi:5-methylthioadenosine/S-adenosylhomocysteine deaminase
MGTLDGARSIWLEDVGALQAGMKADFIALDIDQPHFFPKTNFISHAIYSASAKDVADVWVDGKMLVKNGEILTLDEEKVLYEAQRCFERLVGQA